MSTNRLPVVNMQRDDFCVTLAASLAFLGLAVVCTLWHPDIDAHTEGNYRWLDVVILFATCTSVILLVIALLKLICGQGDLCMLRGDDYEEIDDASPHLSFLHGISPRLRLIPSLSAEDSTASPVGRIRSGMWAGPITAEAPRQDSAPVSLEPHVQLSRRSGDTVTIPGQGGTRSVSDAGLLNNVALRPIEVQSLPAGEIDSGMELECSTHPFLHNGLHFDAGTWRVLQVRKGSCCDRQGTCGSGDVILSLNGVRLAEVDSRQVPALLRGRPGTTIAMEVLYVDSRHAVARQLILTPSPADLRSSSASLGLGRLSAAGEVADSSAARSLSRLSAARS